MSNCPTNQADFDNYDVPNNSRRLNDVTPAEWTAASNAYFDKLQRKKEEAEYEEHRASLDKCTELTKSDYKLGIMQTPEDPNVTAVMQLLKDRADVGMTKYGVTTSQNPLDLIEWLAHLQEELLDAAVYIERTIEELSK